MVTHHLITFPTQHRPSLVNVVQKVEAISELAMHYMSETFALTCPTLNLQTALYESEENGYQITTFVSDADYLMVTTIYALMTQGGAFEGVLPPWAGQPWHKLNKLWYRFRRNRIYYPCKEF